MHGSAYGGGGALKGEKGLLAVRVGGVRQLAVNKGKKQDCFLAASAKMSIPGDCGIHGE